MKTPSGESIVYYITTMDGTPVTKDDGSVMRFLTRESVRKYAKNLTFKKKIRHHTWSCTEKEWHTALHNFTDLGLMPTFHKQ